MIGLIAAMTIEMEALQALMTETAEETVSGIRFVRGKLCGRDVVTAVCGIGKVAAAMCTQTMILRYSPEAVVNTGVAGSLTAMLSIGDIVVSSGVVQHDMDTSPIGDPIGLISGINLVEIPANEALCAQLTAAAHAENLHTLSGLVASGDQFVASSERKEFIVKNFGAIACEMEGAAIGQVCFVNKVPFCVLRAISDSADGSSHMDYPQFAKMAAANSVKLLCAFLAK